MKNLLAQELDKYREFSEINPCYWSTIFSSKNKIQGSGVVLLVGHLLVPGPQFYS